MNMKKLLATILTLTLLACGLAAFAEEAPAQVNEKFNTLIEDGEFIIQVDAGEDLAWLADDMEQGPAVVQLACADNLEGTFVARYSPVGDGDMTVGVRHYAGIACDEVMTWDLHVENGAVQEVIGGSYAVSPADEEIDASLLGEWLEADTQATALTIEKNPERGWDIEIVSPVSHGAYVFKTSVLYDCELNALLYDKGKFWDIDGNYEEGAELGEAAMAGTTGELALLGDEQSPVLGWHDDERQVDILFVPAGEAAE